MSDMKWGKGVLGDPVSQREFYRGRVLALEGVLEGSMEIQKQDQDTITRLRKERNEINDDRHEQINQLLEARETLAEANAKIHDLEEWIAGAKGGVMLMYPPRVGPHTEEAYCAHKSRYMASAAALTSYAEGADCVAAGHMEVKQLRHHDQREIAQLRIERDNAREMEDVHGDNWEAAQAEVERLTAELATALATPSQRERSRPVTLDDLRPTITILEDE